MILPILGKILGSGDVVEKGMALIDSMHTSTEEEIAAKSKAKIDQTDERLCTFQAGTALRRNVHLYLPVLLILR